MSLVEFASWCCVTSPQIDIVTTAQRCIRLLGLMERNPAFPRPSYFSEEDFAERAAITESMGGPHLAIGGRISIQKRIRRMVVKNTHPTPVHLMVFHGIMARFWKLTGQVEHANQNQRKDHTISRQASTDQFHEWQNVMYLGAAGACEWMEAKEDVFPEHILPLLPPLFQGQRGRPDKINLFIEEVFRLLCSENITIRQSAKEALGTELNFMLMPRLFKYLDV